MVNLFVTVQYVEIIDGQMALLCGFLELSLCSMMI